MNIITEKEIDLLKNNLVRDKINMDFIREILIKEKKVLLVCGPTCCGKSNLAVNLAILFKTNIISIDSMQVYKGMNIGTDKLRTEKYKINQYMIDLFEPGHNVTAVEFRDICRSIIEKEFFEKKNIPILVGGSGLYIRAVIDDLEFTSSIEEINNKAIRENIKNEIKLKGTEHFFNKLIEIDPQYCKKISKNDERRITRALEVYEITGKPFSYFQNKWSERKSIYNCTFIGLFKDKNNLNDCIVKRIERMFSDGLLEEIKTLIGKGYRECISLNQAVGYKEILDYLNNSIVYEEAIKEIIKNTKKLVKKQLTWFKADPRIEWIKIDNYYNICDLISDTIKIIWKDLKYEHN
ncbi:MAG: tRNA (adenosine(37)-N6)-dimethylallyltransferase MiaA [Actinobacteria bacterium]|nr:tRNA (adenosine(37)-N6)-dimethylallyltransferase MiaA [Actinomycetota bacterium]